MLGEMSLGIDVETGEPLRISDRDRCGGLYVLGAPRVGKSTFFVGMALQDIERGHGLLFIDPHADAIADILTRIPTRRLKDVILLDPTDSEYAFGINPLYCANPQNLQEQQLCLGQARDVFSKTFEKDEQLGIWLRKYLINCLYPLIENPGYTLYDMWLFLHNKPFRDALLNRLTSHREVVDFWHEEFDKMPRRDREFERSSLLTRLNILNTNPFIKHVISQVRPTIDFVEVMTKKKIVLLRIPSWQDAESRAFIGILVISQLLKTIFLRTEVAQHLRTPFAIYCDEFQNFATPDFATLFTQTGKFNIMPAVGHQVRLGQLKPDDPNFGATLVAPIKVIFRTAVPDSMELSPELAKASPTHTIVERKRAISQEPVKELLNGHTNPQIRAFVNRYLRPLQYRLEDTKENMEGERLLRQVLLDDAAIYRTEERSELLNRSLRIPVEFKAIVKTEQALIWAKERSAKLLALHDSANRTRLTIRSLNVILTAIMEGRFIPQAGQESFSALLIVSVRGLSSIPARYEKFNPLLLYIAVKYGDPAIQRSLPYALAKRHGLFPQTVRDIEQAVAVQDEQEQEQRLQELQNRYDDQVRTFVTLRQQINQGRVECVRRELAEWKFDLHIYPYLLIQAYVPLFGYPSVQQVLAPYFTARFAPPWRDLLSRSTTFLPGLMKNRSTTFLPGLMENLKRLREENARQRKKSQEYVKGTWVAYKKDQAFWLERRGYRKKQSFLDFANFKDYWKSFQVCLHDFVLDAFQKFLAQYGEGALVTLVLLLTAQDPTRWRPFSQQLPKPEFVKSKYMEHIPSKELWLPRQSLPDHWRQFHIDYARYPGFNTLYLPTLVNRDPLEILLVLEKLHEILTGRNFANDFAKYYWIGEEGEPQPYRYQWLHPPVYLAKINPYDIPTDPQWNGYSNPDTKILARNTYQKGTMQSALEQRQTVQLQRLSNGRLTYSKGATREQREDMQLLGKVVYARREWPRWYREAEGLVQTYLQCRACDIARYGEQIADLTFPQPRLNGVAPKAVSDLIASMTAVLEEDARPKDKAEEAVWIAKYQEERSAIFSKWMKTRIVPTPFGYFVSQVLSAGEREAVQEACLTELLHGEEASWAKDVLTKLEEFVRFCQLLARPENHVETQTAQYVEIPVNTYSTHEMRAQMEGELIKLPRSIAYAKVIQEVNGSQIVQTVKIQTHNLPQASAPAHIDTIVREQAIDTGILKQRSEIDAEIIERQAPWRSRPDDDPPLLPSGGDKPPSLPPHRPTTKSESPPPTHYIPAQTPENTLPESRVIPSQPSRIDTNKSRSKKVSPRGKILDITPRLPKRQEEVGNKRKTQKNLSNAKNLHDGAISRLAQTLRVFLPYRVSPPYVSDVDGSIERVSYVIKGGFFNLIVLLKDRILFPKEKIVFTNGDHLPVLGEKQIQDMQQLKGRPRKELIIAIPCQSDAVQKVDYTVSGNYLHINIHGSIASSFYKSKIRFPRCLPG